MTELPRQPGARETRWMHLLSGEPVPELASPTAAQSHASEDATAVEIASLKEDMRQLEQELAAVKREVASLRVALDEKR